MRTEEPQRLFLKDYQAPDFSIESTELWFDLDEDSSVVRSRLAFKRLVAGASLLLDGENLELISLKVDGQILGAQDYEKSPEQLRILRALPASFVLEAEVRHQPQKNDSLEGFYKSGSMFCTQCEAQSFRKITYFLDRPDVMSRFRVHISAPAKNYPVLLSNGDCTDKKNLADGRHQVTFVDPSKKPCYLFALVAGDLGVIRDEFTTLSGRQVALEIYAAHGLQERCVHAMKSLKKSMKWDEERFGREYDLSTYMIVAADDFNAGAMENKGLNIFNSKLILADDKTATDGDFFQIESVVAHEYFHNWTGNRITLRDWFHLSLKEGLTVFRDQEFSADMSSKTEVRIDSVNTLRVRQFAEDAGPNAHPIRPESCLAVDNFFTATIYEKGAEVIRMMQTMVGRPGFRRGMDLYFKRHDGQAVIIEDFAKAISDANEQSWDQFKLWYSQSCTPVVQVKETYQDGTYKLTLSQSTRPSPGQPSKLPFHIPLVFGLLSPSGQELNLPLKNATTKNSSRNSEGQNLLHLRETTQDFIWEGFSAKPILSLNRQFSAPITLDWDLSEEQLQILAAHDTDEFNRWEALQKLGLNNLIRLKEDSAANKPMKASELFLNALKFAWSSKSPAGLKAQFLTLPSDSVIFQSLERFSSSHLRNARRQLRLEIAKSMELDFRSYLEKGQAKSPGERALANVALQYLALLPDVDQLAFVQFQNAQNMTQQQGALVALCQLPIENTYRQKALADFYQQWKDDALVLNKWFSVQATAPLSSTFSEVKRLSQHPDFQWKNPNRVYSLLRNFGDNLLAFPQAGAPQWLADKILELDKINPSVATRLAASLNIAPKVSEDLRHEFQTLLQSLKNGGLSKNSFEIVAKISL